MKNCDKCGHLMPECMCGFIEDHKNRNSENDTDVGSAFALGLQYGIILATPRAEGSWFHDKYSSEAECQCGDTKVKRREYGQYFTRDVKGDTGVEDLECPSIEIRGGSGGSSDTNVEKCPHESSSCADPLCPLHGDTSVEYKKFSDDITLTVESNGENSATQVHEQQVYEGSFEFDLDVRLDGEEFETPLDPPEDLDDTMSLTERHYRWLHAFNERQKFGCE